MRAIFCARFAGQMVWIGHIDLELCARQDNDQLTDMAATG